MLFCNVQYSIGQEPLVKVASFRFPIKDSTSITDAQNIVNSLFAASYATVKEVSIVAVQEYQESVFPLASAPKTAFFPLIQEDIGTFSLAFPYPKATKSLEDIKTLITSQSAILGDVISPYYKY